MGVKASGCHLEHQSKIETEARPSGFRARGKGSGVNVQFIGIDGNLEFNMKQD